MYSCVGKEKGKEGGKKNEARELKGGGGGGGARVRGSAEIMNGCVSINLENAQIGIEDGK